MITRYIIASEDGRRWATFLDLEKAKDWLELANNGIATYHRWPREQKFTIIEEYSDEYEAQCWRF